MALLRHCFDNSDFLRGENLRSTAGRQQRKCIIFFFEVFLLKNLICSLGVIFGGCQRLMLRVIHHHVGVFVFIFLIFIFFLHMYILNVFGLVGVEAKCNLCIRDINIFSL
jgi:hypothetical protein